MMQPGNEISCFKLSCVTLGSLPAVHQEASPGDHCSRKPSDPLQRCRVAVALVEPICRVRRHVRDLRELPDAVRVGVVVPLLIEVAGATIENFQRICDYLRFAACFWGSIQKGC